MTPSSTQHPAPSTAVSRPPVAGAGLDPVAAFTGDLRTRRLRTLTQFAESEIIVPDGPFRDQFFRISTMPWVGLAYTEIESGRWTRIFARGAVQSGKTFVFLVIPVAYALCELEENVIIGAPKAQLAFDVWNERILPAVRRTRYSRLLPAKGAGSRGGKADSIHLSNGATLRFMGWGGGDAQISSHAARHAFATEIDKGDTPGEASREADPMTKLEARTAAYGPDARFWGECTTTYDTGRIFQESDVRGTGTQVFLRCPHCGFHIYPLRGQVVGWRDAETSAEAGRNARYQCQRCEAQWTEADREAAMLHPLLVHKSQHIDEHGDLVGPVPDTNTFGIIWPMMCSCIPARLDYIGTKEFEADRTADPSLERDAAQYIWAIPYKETERPETITGTMLAQLCAEDLHFDPKCVTPKSEGRSPTAMPAGADFIVGSVDVQKRWLYFQIDAYAHAPTLTCWHLAWGVENLVPQGADWDPTEAEIAAGLDRVHAFFQNYGAATEWYDTGYKHEGALTHVIRTWCARRGASVHALVGRSETQMAHMVTGKNLPLPPSCPDMVQCRLQDDGQILWFFDVDRIKDEFWFRLFYALGVEGCHTYPREAANRNRSGRARGGGDPLRIGF
ncbi:MAG TPA: terminase gpA endonuclease subunit, partial [Phycisphaerae bacterium]|nr:terminase gpA endonuclease subunit [Phycisphaerae bacterium]